MTIENLTSLPDPSIFKAPNYQSIYDSLVSSFKTKAPEYTNFQDSDMLMIGFSVVAGKILENQLEHNNSVKQLLLKTATGDLLEGLGGNYGVFRLTGETDDALRERISDRIDAFSNAATEAHYKYFTRASSVLVDSVAISKPFKNDNLVEIAIKSTDNNGIASEELVDLVTEYLNQDHIRAINDRLSIIGATTRTINVTANITMLENSSLSIEDLEEVFTTSFYNINKLGRDITMSWIIGALNTEDVYKVQLVSPTTDYIIAFNEFGVLGTVTLNEVENRNF